MIHIEKIETPEQIRAAFRVVQALRPHINDPERMVEQVLRQMEAGYQMVGIREGAEYVSYTGFRFCEFLAWGKVIYIDDLSTLPETRGKGYGAALLDYVKDLAIQHGCDGVHLDTGYSRHDAHRLYLNKGYTLNCHHMMVALK